MLPALCLFIACMLFVGENNSVIISNSYMQYGSSFDVTLSASIVALIGGILVAKHNQPVTPYTTFGVGFNGAQTVHNQFGYPVQPQPAGNVFYTATGQTSYTMNYPPAASTAQTQEVKPTVG